MTVRVAFDVGTVRIGVATCDPGGILASPQTAILAGPDSIVAAMKIIDEFQPSEIIVGLPITLKGTESSSTHIARDWACQLEAAVPIPVILIDERLTTVQAQSSFAHAGIAQKKSRQRIDSAAAAVLLQHYLETLAPRE